MRFSALQLEDFPGAQEFLRCVDDELIKADDFLKTLDNLDNKYVQVTTHQKGCSDVPCLKESRPTQPAFQPASPIPKPSDQLTMLRWSKLENQPFQCVCACRKEEDPQECRCLGLKLLKPHQVPPPRNSPPPVPPLNEELKEQENLQEDAGSQCLVSTPPNKHHNKVILDHFLEDVREIKRNVETMQAAIVALAERAEGKNKLENQQPQRQQLVNSIKPKRKERSFRF